MYIYIVTYIDIYILAHYGASPLLSQAGFAGLFFELASRARHCMVAFGDQLSQFF